MVYLQIRTPSRRRYLDMLSMIGDYWFSQTNAWIRPIGSLELGTLAFQEVMSPIVIGGAGDNLSHR